MKITAQLFTLLFLFVTLSSQLAGADLGELTKTIKRDFDITADGLTSISNKHGKVEINAWDQNKVKVEVFIKVESGRKEDAQRMLDGIDVDFSNTASRVSAATVFNQGSRRMWNQNGRSKIAVDYVVHLPATNDLELTHSHGKAMIPDMKAEVKISFRHGNFRAGDLGREAKIDMAHSKGSFGVTGDLQASVSHGSLTAARSGDVSIDLRHATFELENGGTITSDSGHSTFILGSVASYRNGSSSHDRIRIESAEMVKVHGSHTRVRINKASKVLDLELSHGGCSAGLGDGFSEVNLIGSHSSFGLDVGRNAAFSMEASAQHGGISYPDEMDVRYHVEKNSSKTIKGSIGGDAGRSVLKARLSHGSLKVNRM